MHGVTDSRLQDLPCIDEWRKDRHRTYEGADQKIGLIAPDGTGYLVKYTGEHNRENDMDTSYVNNVLSEYLSSHILGIVGFPVHDTQIAVRDGEIVVVCKNFLKPGQTLFEFNHYMKEYYNSSERGRVPDLEQIKYVMSHNEDLQDRYEEFIYSYWERFVGDALVGNFDRHMGNFGYVIDIDDSVSIAPIYDNGSTLLPALSEKAMREDILPNKKEILRCTLLFPKAALSVNGVKVGYLDMMTSGCEEMLSRAVRETVPGILERRQDIHDFLDDVSFLSGTRKEFYKTILDARMKYLLEPAYRRCCERRYDDGARLRIETGTEYKETDFEEYYSRIESEIS